MEYIPSAKEFHDVADSLQKNELSNLFKSVLNRINEFHNKFRLESSSNLKLDDYFEMKVKKNLEYIFSQDSILVDGTLTSINGQLWNSRYLEVVNNYELFAREIKYANQSVIHGDLTIENILIDVKKKNLSEAWFLIDPNPASTFSSPLNDYSKLLQSLHLGYESINRNPRFRNNGGVIEIELDNLGSREALTLELHDFINTNYGPSVLREIYLHEIVDYLRLIPYQFRRSSDRGNTFVLALGLLLIEFNQKYLD
jgi:hypothetical protein